MINLNGRIKTLKKSISIKILILASERDVKIFDLFYILACTYIFDEKGRKLQNMQSINPILYVKKELKTALIRLYKTDLIYFENHLIKLTYKGDAYVRAIRKEKFKCVNDFISRINYCGSNYRELYLKFAKGER